MSRYFAVCGGLTGWALGVLVPSYARWPTPFYDPAARRWLLARTAGPLPIGYYGLVLYGVAFALIGAAVGRLAGRRAQSESIWLGAAWAMTAVVVTCAYYTFQLWP